MLLALAGLCLRTLHKLGNFGLFNGNYETMRNVAMRIRDAALELGCK